MSLIYYRKKANIGDYITLYDKKFERIFRTKIF